MNNFGREPLLRLFVVTDLSQEEVWLMPFGILLDLWECLRKWSGIAKPKPNLTIDDVIPYGI